VSKQLGDEAVPADAARSRAGYSSARSASGRAGRPCGIGLCSEEARLALIVAATLAACAAAVIWTLPAARVARARRSPGRPTSCATTTSGGRRGREPRVTRCGAGSRAREKPGLALTQQLEQLHPPADEARDYARFLDSWGVRSPCSKPSAWQRQRTGLVRSTRAATSSRRVHAAEDTSRAAPGFFVCGREQADAAEKTFT